jgi:hypothetical protein
MSKKEAAKIIENVRKQFVFLPTGSKKGDKTDKLYSKTWSDLSKALGLLSNGKK